MSQKAVSDANERVSQSMKPHLMAACDVSRKAWEVTQAHTAAVFKSDAVRCHACRGVMTTPLCWC